ncbi:GumC family protein [Moorena producens]|uniref:GumC family protein n=1 Tax=Moorena producens TaxID=1155739 RepID=UPI003C71FC8B
MTESSIPIRALPKARQRSRPNRLKWFSYISLGILSNAAILGLAFFVLQQIPRTYTSKAAAIIPGVGSQGSVQLPGVGQASSNPGDKSPYGYLLKVDPRENYQYIAMSEVVLDKAAAAVNTSVKDFEEFAKPRVSLDRGTTIIEFEADGKSKLEAQRNTRAFYEALVKRIDDLRVEESSRQDNKTLLALDSANSNLKKAQTKLSQFKKNSPLKISEQIKNLSEEVESLRVERANLLAQQQAATSGLRQLEANLRLSTDQAADALMLQDDEVFKKLWQNYSDISANLTILNTQWTPNSPQVINLKAKKQAALEALLARSQQLLGKRMDVQRLDNLNLGLDAQTGRANLAQVLINQRAQQQGLTGQVNTLAEQIAQLESRLQTLIEKQLTLTELEREVQISEAIFTAKSAQLNVNKSDHASAYPTLQLLVEPNLPKEPVGNTKKTVILGAVALCLLMTTGLVILAWEKPSSKTDAPKDSTPVLQPES